MLSRLWPTLLCHQLQLVVIGLALVTYNRLQPDFSSWIYPVQGMVIWLKPWQKVRLKPAHCPARRLLTTS